MTNSDERDYAEEAANRADMERENAEEVGREATGRVFHSHTSADPCGEDCPLFLSGRDTTAVILCSNQEDHDEDVPAIFDVSFPDGRWNGCTACRECFEIIIENMLDSPTPCLFVPVNLPAPTPVRFA